MSVKLPFLEHHLIEFISQSELSDLLQQLGGNYFSVSSGRNFVSYSDGDHLFFFTSKDGSCRGDWNDENCTEHLVVYASYSGFKPTRYEFALSHMGLTAVALKRSIKNYIALQIAEFESLHSARPFHSHNQQPTLESIQAAFLYPSSV